MAEADKLAIQVVAATARLVAKLQLTPVLGKSPSELDNICWCIGDGADEADLAVAALLGDRHRNAGLVHVKADVKRLLHHCLPHIVDAALCDAAPPTLRQLAASPHRLKGHTDLGSPPAGGQNAFRRE